MAVAIRPTVMMSVQRAKKGAACKDCARRKRKCNHPVVKETRTTISSRLVDTIKSLRLDHIWLSMVPCRVGNNPLVDSAIHALVGNRHRALTRTEIASNVGFRDYASAVERLRRAMEQPERCIGDDTLLAVALLCVCEALMDSEMSLCFSHWCGMRAILLSRPPSAPVSDLARAILYHIRNQTFHIPVAMGTASPFDEPRWYTLQPAGQHLFNPEILALKRCSNELLIRLPRLIALVRKLRETMDAQLGERTMRLAHELATLQDAEAESRLLHGVRVVKTLDGEQRTLMPISFEFASLGQLETAVVYWKYQLLLFNLLLKLEELFPGVAGFADGQVLTEMQRMAVNVAMSWQYAATRKQRAHSKGHVAMPTALLTLYGVFQHIDEFRGVPVQRWRQWTLDRSNEVNAVWSVVATEADLAECCELFVGGPLRGLFVSAYSEVPFWVKYQYPRDDGT